MANRDVARIRQEREKLAFESVYKEKEPDNLIFKKTHKGIDHLGTPQTRYFSRNFWFGVFFFLHFKFESTVAPQF